MLSPIQVTFKRMVQPELNRTLASRENRDSAPIATSLDASAFCYAVTKTKP